MAKRHIQSMSGRRPGTADERTTMTKQDLNIFPADAIYLRDVIENLPVGVIIVDREGRVVWMNRWQEHISRVRREQILGSYFHEKWERLFQQGIMSEYWKMLENDTPFNIVVHDIYPQFYDERISAISRGVPLPEHDSFILLHDISSEMQADKKGLERLTRKHEEQTAFLTNLIDSSPNIVITTDEKGRIQSVNRTGETKLECGREQLAGREIGFIFHEGDRRDHLVTASETGRIVEVRCLRRSGGSFPARVQVRDIRDPEGRVQAVLYIIADISREKAMEEKLALSEKLAIYSELMAGIAHQINNPMVGVANFSSLLLDRMDPDDPNREIAETIHEASGRCRTMLASMIKSLREPRSTFHRVDLGEVLGQAVKDLKRDRLTPSVVVSSEIPDGLPPVRGDAIQLLEVYRNLIDNAMEAMPDGGCLTTRALVDPEGRQVVVEICDTGVGIDRGRADCIFEPFFTTKGGAGRGLGLSFAFRVIENHAGRIDVRPADPHGSVFTVALPIMEGWLNEP